MNTQRIEQKAFTIERSYIERGSNGLESIKRSWFWLFIMERAAQVLKFRSVSVLKCVSVCVCVCVGVSGWVGVCWILKIYKILTIQRGHYGMPILQQAHIGSSWVMCLDRSPSRSNDRPPHPTSGLKGGLKALQKAGIVVWVLSCSSSTRSISLKIWRYKGGSL